MQLNIISHVIFLFVLSCGFVSGAETEVKLSHSNVSCNGGSDGEVNISVIKLSGPVFISIEDTSTQIKYTKKFLSDTIYKVTELRATKIILLVKTENKLLLQEELAISEPAVLSGAQIEILQAPVSDESCDAKLKVEAKGGTPPYSYAWSENTQFATSKIIENLCMGIYRCEINDSKLCEPVHISIPLFKNTIDNYSTSKK